MSSRTFGRRLAAYGLGCAIALTALAPSLPALAEEGRMQVDLAGLDLRSDEGAHRALVRIERASSAFCEDGRGPVPLDRHAAIRRCETAMIDKAVDQLGAPRVTAAHRGAASATQLARR